MIKPLKDMVLLDPDGIPLGNVGKLTPLQFIMLDHRDRGIHIRDNQADFDKTWPSMFSLAGYPIPLKCQRMCNPIQATRYGYKVENTYMQPCHLITEDGSSYWAIRADGRITKFYKDHILFEQTEDITEAVYLRKEDRESLLARMWVDKQINNYWSGLYEEEEKFKVPALAAADTITNPDSKQDAIDAIYRKVRDIRRYHSELRVAEIRQSLK